MHAETSTGVENEIAPLRALRDTDTLLLVDTVTSLGGIPVEVDGWGIDACYSGTQKCLGVPPGLAPVTFSARAVERVQSRPTPPQSWYLDLGLIGDYVGGARKYHHTAPTAMVVALHAGLGVLLDEGLEASWARHQAVGRRLQQSLDRAGLVPDRRGGPPAAPAHLGAAARPAWTRRACGRSCWPSTASRSAAGWASSPAWPGGSGSWGIPPANARSPPFWGPSASGADGVRSGLEAAARDVSTTWR